MLNNHFDSSILIDLHVEKGLGAIKLLNDKSTPPSNTRQLERQKAPTGYKISKPFSSKGWMK